MFSTDNVQIFAKVRMFNGLKNLGTTKNSNGIRCQWKSITAAHIARMAFGKECDRCKIWVDFRYARHVAWNVILVWPGSQIMCEKYVKRWTPRKMETTLLWSATNCWFFARRAAILHRYRNSDDNNNNKYYKFTTCTSLTSVVYQCCHADAIDAGLFEKHIFENIYFSRK